MKKLLYRIAILTFILFIGYFLSLQYNYYLDSNTYYFHFTHKIILGSVLFIGYILFFLWVHSNEKILFIKIGNSIAYSIFVLLFTYYIIKQTLITGTLLINRVVTQEIVKETFEINVDKSYHTFSLLATVEGNLTYIDIKSKFPNIDISTIEKGDSIAIQLERGLFNYYYINFHKTKIIKSTSHEKNLHP